LTLTKNQLTGSVSLVAGLIYLVASIRLPESAVSDPIGPRAYPIIVAIGMILVGLALLIKREKLTEKTRAVIVHWPAEREMVVRIAWTCVGGIAFGLILEKVGYLISSFLFMTAMLYITNGRRHLYNAAIGLVFALSTYGLFFGLLDVSLPRGILAF
jgi:putative tricarboxylic transport membrane protein